MRGAFSHGFRVAVHVFGAGHGGIQFVRLAGDGGDLTARCAWRNGRGGGRSHGVRDTGDLLNLVAGGARREQGVTGGGVDGDGGECGRAEGDEEITCFHFNFAFCLGGASLLHPVVVSVLPRQTGNPSKICKPHAKTELTLPTFRRILAAVPTFAEYLEKWLKQSTAQGLSNPLVKMPVKRFRPLQPDEFSSLANGGSLIIGTMSEPIARNLQKNYLTRIRERGEHCAFVCFGSVEMIVAGGTDGKQRKQLFPVCLKRASFQTSGDKIKAVVDEDDVWQFNPVLQAHLRGLTITVAIQN